MDWSTVQTSLSWCRILAPSSHWSLILIISSDSGANFRKFWEQQDSCHMWILKTRIFQSRILIVDQRWRTSIQLHHCNSFSCHLSLYFQYKSSDELWTIPKKGFRSLSKTHLHLLKSRSNNLSKQSGPMEDYLQQIKEIADQLSLISSPVTDEDKVLFFDRRWR